MSMFDSSDEDERLSKYPTEPLSIDRLALPSLNSHHDGKLYLSGCPGFWFRNVNQNMNEDLELLTKLGISDAIILLETFELKKYRAPHLLSRYSKCNIRPHSYPHKDGSAPDLNKALALINIIIQMIKMGKNVLLHCACGYGRTGMYAALLLQFLDPFLSPAQSIEKIRSVRGARAIQTVSQYNFVMDFGSLMELESDRSLSR